MRRMRSARSSSGTVELMQRRRDAPGLELLHLVLHQRDERRDDQRQPLQHHRRQLVAEALARAGGHHHHHVAPGEHRVHHLGLARPEGGESEGPLEFRARVVVEPERLRHAPHLHRLPPAVKASPEPAGSAWRSPARASETYRPAPTTRWSRTRRWKILAPACSSRVSARIRLRGLGVSRGVVVGEDDRRRPRRQRRPEHLPRVHRAGVRRPLRHPRVTEQRVPGVERQHVEHLVPQEREARREVAVHLPGGPQPGTAVGSHVRSPGELQRRQHLRRTLAAQPRRVAQLGRLHARQSPEPTRRREQRLTEPPHRPASPPEEQPEQLGIVQRVRRRQQPLPRQMQSSVLGLGEAPLHAAFAEQATCLRCARERRFSAPSEDAAGRRPRTWTSRTAPSSSRWCRAAAPTGSAPAPRAPSTRAPCR